MGAVPLPTPSLEHVVSIPSVYEVETSSSVPSVWIKETSRGALNAVPARPVSLIRLQCLKQRIGANQDFGQERHRFVDATPFGQWYESHYAIPLNRKKGTKMTAEEELALNKPRSKKTDKKYKL